MKIILGCQKDDNLQDLCKDFFGSENIEVLNRNGILSLDEVAIVISVADLTVATIGFLYTVLATWKSVENSTDVDKENIKDEKNSIDDSFRRVIITREGDINLEGYTAKEVERILKILEKNHNDG